MNSSLIVTSKQLFDFGSTGAKGTCLIDILEDSIQYGKDKFGQQLSD